MGASALREDVNTPDAATVYFGKDDEDKEGAWRVIGYDGIGAASERGRMMLLAAGNMGTTVFDDDRDDSGSHAYATSDLKKGGRRAGGQADG